MALEELPACAVCGSSTVPAGVKRSEFSDRDFALGHCPSCRYSFVVDPRTDFADIYDEAYYAGRGTDPHTSYAGALARAGSVQEYE